MSKKFLFVVLFSDIVIAITSWFELFWYDMGTVSKIVDLITALVFTVSIPLTIYEIKKFEKNEKAAEAEEVKSESFNT